MCSTKVSNYVVVDTEAVQDSVSNGTSTYDNIRRNVEYLYTLGLLTVTEYNKVICVLNTCKN